MVAGVPRQGGATWAVLQYLLGLRRLGHRVTLVEPVDPPPGVALADSAMASYGEADVLLNVSGMLADEALLDPVPVRAYLDLDPAFNQLWHHLEGIDMRFDGHTHFVTAGLSLGMDGCPVPTCGRRWITTLPPVVLDEWPVAAGEQHRALTTVGNFRGYGSIRHDGVLYGQKAHSLRALADVPVRARERFVLALAIHPDERRDLEMLRANGWELVDPAARAARCDRRTRPGGGRRSGSPAHKWP
jgi:hypothetical protein